MHCELDILDAARSYTDSEKMIGIALSHFPNTGSKITIATKTPSKNLEAFWKGFETSLERIQTDYIDIYQFHMADRCYRLRDGTGMYECMHQAKAEGRIRQMLLPVTFAFINLDGR